MTTPTPTTPTPEPNACICVFDVDRTLTGKQGLAEGSKCPDNKMVDGVWDSAYGGGTLTLSPAAQNLNRSRWAIKGILVSRYTHIQAIMGMPFHGTFFGDADKKKVDLALPRLSKCRQIQSCYIVRKHLIIAIRVLFQAIAIAPCSCFRGGKVACSKFQYGLGHNRCWVSSGG